MDDLLRAAERYARGFTAGELAAPPTRRLVILTCMDARLDPERVFGLELGEAHVLRNAGGRATQDALRSLILSTDILGTRTILVVHHTDCGLHASEDVVRAAVEQATGRSARDLVFDAFEDLDQSVRDDIERIAACDHLPPDVDVHGLVYEVETGRVRVVDAA
jgi:carbonic anhydrase